MPKKPEENHLSHNSADSLRRHSEERLKGQARPLHPDLLEISPEQMLHTLHELQVHQVELEMQNEELRRIQEELNTERERYFDLYDLAPVGYLTLSSGGLILEMNLTAAAMLGVPRGLLENKPVSGFIYREDQDVYYLHRKRLVETGEPQEFELRLTKSNGSFFWARLKIVAVRDAEGLTVYRMILNDVTAFKAAEEALNMAREEAAAALAAKSRLAVLQSQIQPHFLFNALSAIISLCYTDGEKAGALLTTFSRFLRMVFSADTQEETVTLQRELELVQMYATIEKARYGERLHTVFHVDESLLNQRIIPLVLQPLVENAIRHGVSKKSKGGTVLLRIRQCGHLLKVTVCDNGVGMSRTQVRDILARQDTETGVGIANISQRLHLHFEKKLRIRSAEGVGTVIVFYLPLETGGFEPRG